MKNIIITLSLLFPIVAASAQGIGDACLFSQTQYQGTSKALGMGNALGAVGGDMTAVCINPAGLGLYRSNEITATLNLLDNVGASTYYGNNATSNKFRMTLPNIGYVNAKERSNYRGLRFTQFGIGLTRTNDFNLHTLAIGLNPTSSKIDNYLSQIDGLSPADIKNEFPMDIYPAWETYLIDIYQDSIGDYYDSPVPQGGIRQSQENTFKGRSEEWTFAGSMNLLGRFFVGISAGLQHIKREGIREFREQMPDDAVANTGFGQWSFTENISSTGWGVNVKAGFIYHANHWLRLGAAFHSPTIYKFDESWQTETESQINWITNKYISLDSHYEYIFIKPMKWVGSMAFVIRQSGIVSLDAEYINYGAARFMTVENDDFDYGPTNGNIKDTFGKTLNFRIGSEWMLSKATFRMGVGYYGSPFGIGKPNGSLKKASVGIGLPVSESTSFDFVYEMTYGKNQSTLYEAGNIGIEPVTQRQFKSNFAITLKIRY